MIAVRGFADPYFPAVDVQPVAAEREPENKGFFPFVLRIIASNPVIFLVVAAAEVLHRRWM